MVFWRWAGSRELLLCSAVLLLFAIPALFWDVDGLGILAIPWRLNTIVLLLLETAQMALLVEFIWTIHGLQARALKRLAQATLLVFNGAGLYTGLITVSSGAVYWLFVAGYVCVQIFNLITIATNLLAFFIRRQNRLIAAALALIPIAAQLAYFGMNTHPMIGPFLVSYFNVGIFVSSLALFVMLGQRTWRAWRARDELRIEFEAAREVQQQLVAPPVDVPGFTIESVYAPARQVGGDFFRIAPEAQGGVLLVVGDVSGKGLKAAMTVSTIMGALRGCAAHGPAEILSYLNRVLHGQVGGFVTCCATLLAADGSMIHANAGNPAPYRNGEEMAVETGLPLGIVAENSFVETRYQLAAGDRLTFISDGVVEATSPGGELYGFARTQAISDQPAHAIAEAARRFGQEDDITVVSVVRNAG